MTLAKAKRKHRRKSKKVGSVRMSLLNLCKQRTDVDVWYAIRRAISGLTLKQHPNIDVTVTGSPSYGGTYYQYGCTRQTPLVVARANEYDDSHNNKNSYYPKKTNPAQGGYLPQLWLDSTEGLIAILAHELCHAWQAEHEHKRRYWRRKVWGARGVSSDKECDAHAIRKVREYRRSPERQRVYEQKVSEAVAKLLPPLLYNLTY